MISVNTTTSGKIDIMCHLIECYETTASVIFQPKLNRDLIMRKPQTIPNQDAVYNMTDPQSSKMVRSRKLTKHWGIVPNQKRRERRDNGEQPWPRTGSLATENIAGKMCSLNSVSGRGVYRRSMHYCSCNCSVVLKCVTFLPWITVMYVLTPFLVHQLFDFRIHSWAQSAIRPQRLERSNPCKCLWKTGGEEDKEGGKEGNWPNVDMLLPCQTVQLGCVPGDAGLDNDCGKFRPCFT